jgi:hypothetical protein
LAEAASEVWIKDTVLQQEVETVLYLQAAAVVVAETTATIKQVAVTVVLVL